MGRSRWRKSAAGSVAGSTGKRWKIKGKGKGNAQDLDEYERHYFGDSSVAEESGGSVAPGNAAGGGGKVALDETSCGKVVPLLVPALAISVWETEGHGVGNAVLHSSSCSSSSSNVAPGKPTAVVDGGIVAPGKPEAVSNAEVLLYPAAKEILLL